MREKTLRFLITFASTTDAIAMERWCGERGVEGRLIPVPRQISASCGMAWSAPAAAKDSTLAALTEARIPMQGSYEIML